MPIQPNLATDDLLLRPMTLADAVRVRELAGDERIADTTADIPHPYPDGEAERWLAEVAKQTAAREQLSWAITAEHILLGCVSLMHMTGDEAELGYWVGVPYWGRGIATRAVRSVVACGFEQLGLKRIHARVLSRNKASAKLLLRQGFIHIGNESTTCGYRGEEAPTDYYDRLADQGYTA
jgi:RimJ/RimL family protein N-acetyltransferase